LVLALNAAGQANADVISTHTAASSTSPTNLAGGLAITTPSGGPWNHLRFSCFSDLPAQTPIAVGHVFLLTQAHNLLPASLSSATPGFVAASMLASGGVWSLAPGVTINPGTAYCFDSDGPGGMATGTIARIPGTTGAFSAGPATLPYTGPNFPMFKFLLQGDSAVAMPEPPSLPILAVGLGIAGWWGRRKWVARST
jgi:hypothetical protein